MARPASKHPTDGELEILQALWDHPGATLGEICGHLRESRDVATTTVATMLKVMLDKGLVERTADGRSYRWRASVSRQRAADSMVGKLVDGLFAGSADQLVAHLVQSRSLSAEQLAELRELIDNAQPKPRRRRRGGKS